MQALSQPTLDLLAKLGFEKPTPVQEAVIPVFSGNKDVAVDACTGSGKTLAFVIPVAERLRGLEEPLLKHQVDLLLRILNQLLPAVRLVIVFHFYIPLCRSEQLLCPQHESLLGRYTASLNHSLPQYPMSRLFCWLAARESRICCHAHIMTCAQASSKATAFVCWMLAVMFQRMYPDSPLRVPMC